MPALSLTPSERAALRTQAQALKPVVLIGAEGLTDAVLAEIAVHLAAHKLIKIRVSGDDRGARDAICEQICDCLDAAPVQRIGKLLVIWKPGAADTHSALSMPAFGDVGTAKKGAAPRIVKVVKRSHHAPAVRRSKRRKVVVRGNERVTAGGNVKRAKKRQISAKRQNQGHKCFGRTWAAKRRQDNPVSIGGADLDGFEFSGFRHLDDAGLMALLSSVPSNDPFALCALHRCFLCGSIHERPQRASSERLSVTQGYLHERYFTMTQQLIVAVFCNVTDAEKAGLDFRNLEGKDTSFKVESGVMVEKDPAGKLTLLGTKTQPFWGVVIGAITGAVIGMLGGPSGAMLGFTIGASTGLAGVALIDILDHEFVDSVSADLMPGCTALILEASEATPGEIDKIVAAHCGIVHRKPLCT